MVHSVVSTMQAGHFDQKYTDMKLSNENARDHQPGKVICANGLQATFRFNSVP